MGRRKTSDMEMIMDILEEMRKANTEYLQDAWDKWLINGWRNSNAITRFSVEAFTKHYKMSYTDFYNLRRVPLNNLQQKTRLSRFIAAFLPKLNTLLWSDRLTDEQILKAMKKYDTQIVASDYQKVHKEGRERRKAMKEAGAENKSHLLVKEQRESTAKSNWKHCK